MTTPKPATGPSAASPDGWRQRVFKNTYTRRGRRIALKRWSVKIQHQGIRRTLALSATARAAAGLEAQALYQTIITEGWDAAAISVAPRLRSNSRRANAGQPHWPKTDARHWQQRLLLRKYGPSLHVAGGELSVRIEHAGMGTYFPLGTSDIKRAAAKALKIYKTVVRQGWEVAHQKSAREFAVAIHWADNPLGWTYSTLHTRPEAVSLPFAPAAAPNKLHWRIALVESDGGIRRALVECLNQHADFRCDSAFGSLTQALRELRRRLPHLVLINHHLANVPVAESLQSLHALAPQLPTLLYSVYEDSEELFKATPGGASGSIG